jgi:hypothetical protein
MDDQYLDLARIVEPAQFRRDAVTRAAARLHEDREQLAPCVVLQSYLATCGVTLDAGECEHRRFLAGTKPAAAHPTGCDRFQLVHPPAEQRHGPQRTQQQEAQLEDHGPEREIGEQQKDDHDQRDLQIDCPDEW